MAAGFFFVHGTWGGLVLRAAQCAFAVASLITMSKALDPIPEDADSADSFLTVVMMFHAMWNFIQVGFHLHFACRRKELHDVGNTCLFIFFDAILTVLSLAAASSSAYTTLLFRDDTGLCSVAQLPCGQFLLSASFAYAASFLQATVALALFCKLVHLVTQQ